MSAISVRREIEGATINDPLTCEAGAHIDEQDASRILHAAAPTPSSLVSKRERTLITDLYDRQPSYANPGAFFTEACPENPHAVSFAPAADRAFNAFFQLHNISRGEVLAGQIDELVKNYGYGSALPAQPDLSGYGTYAKLHDNRPVDGNLLEAFVNLKDRTFYLKNTGSGFGGPAAGATAWYGPTKLDSGLSPEGRQNILRAFAVANQASPIGHRARSSPWEFASTEQSSVPIMRGMTTTTRP